ncbi:hypothetical protein FNV43_RR14982 [Rhamnella rubrinervis]|uniref:RRM domain-containing protein n=1 Tax=Rhamnella rubrinervis TaxID=2594499 RepID=A0A8K0H3X0_9ROSA|nr:hypothetical protein FNV43_RR14982 [Rhamnella rubrinervis]
MGTIHHKNGGQEITREVTGLDMEEEAKAKMALQAGVASSKVLILVGAGLTGSVVLRSGRLSDLLVQLQELLKGVNETEILTNKYDGALIAAQVRQLAQEIRELTLSGPVTIFNGNSTSSGSYASYIMPAAALGVMGYCYMWWKGWSFSDVMFVTKHNMATAVETMSKQLEHVHAALASTKRHLTKRLENLDWKMEEQKETTQLIADDVNEVKSGLSQIDFDVEIIHQMVSGLEGKIELIESKQDMTNSGIWHLCQLAEDLKDGVDTKPFQDVPASIAKHYSTVKFEEKSVKGLQFITEAEESSLIENTTLSSNKDGLDKKFDVEKGPRIMLKTRIYNSYLGLKSDALSDQNDMASKRGDRNPLAGDGASPGKIFIGGLAKDTTIDTFVKYFEKYGEITDSVIMKDRHTGRPRGFGFITYADPIVVDQLIQETHVINGKQVEIKRTIPKGTAQANDFKTKKIFVGGIPTTVTEDEFKSFFSKYGKVVEHELIRDHATKRSRGFGFIVFDNEKVVDNLLADGNMIDMGGTQVEIKKAEPKKASNRAPVPAFGSDSRARPYNDSFSGYGDSFSGFGRGAIDPAPYRSSGGYANRLGDYSGYGNDSDYGGGYGGFGSGGIGGFYGFRGESSFGYSSRFGSYSGGIGGGYGSSGLGAYGRGSGGGYGSYVGSGSGGDYDSGPVASYGGPGGGGLYGGRAGYGGSSRYHPYAR